MSSFFVLFVVVVVLFVFKDCVDELFLEDCVDELFLEDCVDELILEDCVDEFVSGGLCG